MLLSEELPTDNASNAKHLCSNFVKIHQLSGQRRPQDATPRRYISFLKTYQNVFQTKRDDLTKKQSHMQVGLSAVAMFGCASNPNQVQTT